VCEAMMDILQGFLQVLIAGLCVVAVSTHSAVASLRRVCLSLFPFSCRHLHSYPSTYLPSYPPLLHPLSTLHQQRKGIVCALATDRHMNDLSAITTDGTYILMSPHPLLCTAQGHRLRASGWQHPTFNTSPHIYSSTP
jgi:hypothetical protein